MKYVVTFTMISGRQEVFEIENESYQNVAEDIMNHEQWYGTNGRLVNKNNVEIIEIRETKTFFEKKAVAQSQNIAVN
ncbi:hypothetical protein [Paenibacillus abyssi]|uniref:Uncharacterized protein n=1 Tax=Paenibacillus abyssi TaxID=1340531 RepID=A0A917CTW4_9BACL|nr:hypothetical protein [Paenibacillus abyssi]GGF97603.1 hypothetical protein GCM10010916_13570 [Paenibacillus abyssi]